MDDEKLRMLKWHHLKVALDDRENDWPEDSKYEFDQKKQTVTWLFGRQSQAPHRLVWHLTSDELSTPKPTDVTGLIIKWANKVAKRED